MDAKIKKLPKWAQEHINDLQRQRDIAVRDLRDWADQQTPSPFSVSELVSIKDGGPERFVRYVQAHRIDITYLGVEATVILRDRGIDIQYNNDCGEEVALIPYSYQQISLISREKMRHHNKDGKP